MNREKEYIVKCIYSDICKGPYRCRRVKRMPKRQMDRFVSNNIPVCRAPKEVRWMVYNIIEEVDNEIIYE